MNVNTIEIPLSQNGPNAGLYTAVVDVDDIELTTYCWRVYKAGNKIYAVRHAKIEGKDVKVFLHREIYRRMRGVPLSSSDNIDHIDGDGLNCVRNNLRLATHAQNSQNRGKPTNNTSGVKGAYWSKVMNKWHARIMSNGVLYNLGYFNLIEDAAEAYRKAADELHKEFANYGDES